MDVSWQGKQVILVEPVPINQKVKLEEGHFLFVNQEFEHSLVCYDPIKTNRMHRILKRRVLLYENRKLPAFLKSLQSFGIERSITGGFDSLSGRVDCRLLDYLASKFSLILIPIVMDDTGERAFCLLRICEDGVEESLFMSFLPMVQLENFPDGVV